MPSIINTPAGLGECISFNVSSLIPPSPIPLNTTLSCYTATNTKAAGKPTHISRGAKVKPGRNAVATKMDTNGRSHKRAKRSDGVKGVGGPVVTLRRDVDILMNSPDNGYVFWSVGQ